MGRMKTSKTTFVGITGSVTLPNGEVHELHNVQLTLTRTWVQTESYASIPHMEFVYGPHNPTANVHADGEDSEPTLDLFPVERRRDSGPKR